MSTNKARYEIIVPTSRNYAMWRLCQEGRETDYDDCGWVRSWRRFGLHWVAALLGLVGLWVLGSVVLR